MEMNSEQNLELQEAEKKLSEFKSHLNLLMQDVWTSKNVDTNEILSAINELQSLVQWAAQQPELGEESVVLLVKLQELHKLRQNLENIPANTEENNASKFTSIQECAASDQSEIFPKEVDKSDVISADLSKSEDDVNNEAISGSKEPICLSTGTGSKPEEANATTCEEMNEMIKSGDDDNWNLENAETGLNNEERCSDSTEDAVIINSDTELQDLLSSDSEFVIRSDTEIQDSPTTDYKILMKSDTNEEELSPSEIVAKCNAKVQDLTFTEAKDTSEINTDVEELISVNTETLAKNNTEAKNTTSSDAEAFMKRVTEIKDIPSDELDNVSNVNEVVQDVPLCQITTDSEEKVYPVTDSEDLNQSTSEIQDLISNEEDDLPKIEKEVIDMQSVNSKTATSSHTENLDSQFDKNETTTMSENTEALIQEIVANETDINSDIIEASSQESIVNEISIRNNSTEACYSQSVDDKTTTESNITDVSQPQSVEIETAVKSSSTEAPHPQSADDETSTESTKVSHLQSADTESNIQSSSTEAIQNKATTQSNSTEASESQFNESKIPIKSKNTEETNLQVTDESITKSDKETKSLIRCDSERPKTIKKEVRILETNEDNKTTEMTDDSTNSNDPLDVCMYAIRNLYDSLRTKENELLKLSVMQSDQKHIEALQSVIIDFHKDITNLNTQLDKTKKENILLKEQVLELEEAENDARLEAQKLGQKLSFLQEKDSHSQAELHQLKVSLKKGAEKLVEKELVEKELRSQIKYLEALAQKYEEQIKVLETKVVTLSEKIPEAIPKKEVIENAVNTENTETFEIGTQTYVPCEARIRYSKTDILHENDSTDSGDLDSSANLDEGVHISDESHVMPCEIEDSVITSVSDKDAINPKEQVASTSVQKLTQKELLERLHKLVDDDETLQQQIHSLDQINLDLWKKLQNLENNIGECRRKDINETDPSVSNAKRKDCVKDVADAKVAELSDIIPQNNIPEESLNSLDQNEQCIQERLSKLEEINASFEKELKTRENICKEKEKKCEEWMQTEKRLMSDLKRLSEEKDSLMDQVGKLRKEKEALEQRILQQQSVLQTLKEKNEKEILKIKAEQEAVILQHQHKVNSLQVKEKELLKMITKLKAERNRNEHKTELERLKCNYIELQLELSNSRDEIEKLQEKLKIRMEECISKHIEEETKIIAVLECMRRENENCNKMISALQMKQHELLKALEKQENELQIARESYKKTLEDTEEVHRSVETELKNQLQQIEESTVIAATALMEQRVKVEKELQENVDDLRAKEEVYKARIAELESNVVSLREELHKVSNEPQLITDIISIQDNLTAKKVKNTKEIPTLTTTSDVPGASPSMKHPVELEKSLKISSSRCPTPTIPIKTELPSELKTEKITVEKVKKGENVDHLRAQVRELQAQLDRISGEPVEVLQKPPVQPVTPISAPSMGLKKEDIDYAEVDDCLDAWRKPSKTSSSNKTLPLQYQPVYKSRYETRYKQNSTKQKDPPDEQESEDNDYDEVLPRPTNFHVVQQVGSDTLLVGWNYVNPSLLDGFEVYLDNQVHERIYIPDRTKALISGLNLRRPIHLSICALSRYGQMSEPTVLDLPPQTEINEQYFDDEDEEEYRDFENSLYRKQRPYSMEW